MEEFEELLESLKQHIFDSNCQNWLFGAGISRDANIPLMFPLTEYIKNSIKNSDNLDDNEIIEAMGGDLTYDSHIEHYLSHLGDLIAISERSKNKTASINGKSFKTDQLTNCYKHIISEIGMLVRYGYEDGIRGEVDSSKVDIKLHIEFIQALFKNRADLERRSTINFFTTNYDTLLEDALALNKKSVIDGFSGGAVGFWNGEKELLADKKSSMSCLVHKLHGSVDWHKDSIYGLVRARYGTRYVNNINDIMIYPQATKYVETQRDPFSFLFSRFRYALNTVDQNVLIICGYSFGDEHINLEIETALSSIINKTTVIAFTEEKPENNYKINPTLDRWLSNKSYSERIFVAGKSGLYNNNLTPLKPNDMDGDLNWWTFSGLTKFLNTGEIK